MHPEYPYAVAGIVAIAGTIAKRGNVPDAGLWVPVIATLALVTITSASAGTKAAPIVQNIGYLVVLASIMAYVPILSKGTQNG